jgi:hypothetical protein
MKWQQAEKFFAARVAAVGGKSQEPLEKDEGAISYAVTRDVLEVEVSAPRAVRKAGKRDSHARGMEPKFASQASPGPESDS